MKDMPELSDHELLLLMNANLSNVVIQLESMKKDFHTHNEKMEARIRALENETIQLKTAQESADKAIAVQTKDIDDLQTRSNVLDFIVGVLAVVGAAIGSVFGGK